MTPTTPPTSTLPTFFSSAVVAAMMYMTFSTSLTLANKYVFSDEAFNFPWMTLTVQSLSVVICLSCYQLATNGIIFSAVLLRQIFAPCILFSLFLFTNSRALRHLSLPVLSVLKSLAPMGIALAETLMFSDNVTKPVVFSMVLIVASNVITLINVPRSSLVGYGWAIFNVVVNILHVLSLRICLSAKFSPVEKTLHSNLLAAFFMLPLAIAGQEVIPFVQHITDAPFTFQLVFALSCLLASAIGASIFWLVQQTSGSTLSFTGACNKIPVVILGTILFQTHISPQGWVSVFFGISAGVIFAIAKARQKDKIHAADPDEPSVSARLSSRERSSSDIKIQIRNDAQSQPDCAGIENNDDSFHSQRP